MNLITVQSPDDPRLDLYRNLSDAALLAGSGCFIAEGRLVVRRLVEASPFRPRSVLVTPAGRAALDGLEARLGDVPVYEVDQGVMNTITGFNIHRGCLAVGERGTPRDWQHLAATARTLVVLEHVADPDNVGALFRSAAALGAEAVLLDPHTTDPLYRKAIRTSMGAALWLPFARLAEWPADLQRLRALGVTVLALTPDAGADTLGTWIDAHCANADAVRVALLLGHEGAGLSGVATAAADARLRIPVNPEVDSLNVAVAGAIALYEAARLRRG